ncbi:M24 family metallopeptidase [Clostridium sp. OS1-26]|uniref:M24 family metallopeptidase n=1 Tax=Clostridium sp. OS1-26 TaxID=3070681 RepID=UPI0027DFABB3|nr:M24 family metallopeptidase [Clostridium sp. OS1-26]WML32942.1 M24 family metallopeptidase [Clostridium sp. OS1-26]
MDREKRVNSLRTILKDNNIDAVLLTSPHNKYYIANLHSGSGYVFITRKNKYILVDFRYYEEMKKCNNDFNIIMVTKEKSFNYIMNSIIKEENISSIGFEGKEVPYDFYKDMESNLKTNFISLNLDELRKIKDKAELEHIKEACKIADDAFNHIVGFIRAGITEIDVENELVRFIKEQGGEKESFDIIVASGGRGALPHGKASRKVIENGELITMDFGVKYNKYSSDITRTVALGSCPKDLLEVYEIVKKAGEEALKAVKAGITVGELDYIARKIISDAGYGDYFGHNLGHGVGILVHEYPALSPNGKDLLHEGMIITIEPGIYIPNVGGVRIEDDVLVRKDCGERLTKSSKDLIVIGGN